MKSLEELNQYALSPITYIDDRPAGVFFDRGATVDQEITVNENTTFFFPYGIEIEDITQYDVAQMEYVIDLSVFDPQVVYVSFPSGITLPSHISVTRVGNVFTISEIRSKADWDLVKTLRVQPPFSVSGFKPLEGKLRWFADAQAVTRTEAIWDVQLELVPVEYFSAVAAETYVANQQDDQIEVPSIIVDPDEFDPEWTLEISPSVLTAVELIYSTNPSEAETSWNASTRTFSIIGDKTSVNNTLEDLEVDYGRSDADFTMLYLLRNNYNLVTESQVQIFESRDFISDFDLEAQQSAAPNVIYGGTSVPTSFTTFDVNETVILALAVFSTGIIPNATQTIDEVLTTTSTTLNTATTLTSFRDVNNANVRLIFDLSGCDSNATISWTSIPSGVSVTNANSVYTVSNIDSSSDFEAMKNPTITFPASTIDDQVIDVKIRANTSLGTTYEFGYTNTTEYNQFLTNRDTARSFVGNNVTEGIVAAPLMSIEQSVNDTYSLRLIVSSGQLYNGSTFTSNLLLTGTGTQINQSLLNIDYYPARNTTSNHTLTARLTKNSVLLVDATSSLVFTGNNLLDEIVYTFNSNGSFTPSELQKRYQNIDLLVVGGGGGASGTVPTQGGVRVSAAAGGGAGKVVTATRSITNVSGLSISIGAGGATGGASSNNKTQGSSGSSTTVSGSGFSTITATGGTPGIVSNYLRTPTYFNPGYSIFIEGGGSGNGFRGNYTPNSAADALGGGGAGGIAAAGTNQGFAYQAGGPGVQNNITGTNLYYGKGGNGIYGSSYQPNPPESPSATGTDPGNGGGANGNGRYGLQDGQDGIVIIKTVN